jgi:hypothetical protein
MKALRIISGRLALALFNVGLSLWRYSRIADRDHVKTTVKIAGWPPSAADALRSRNIGPAEAARLFADALRPERVQ